MLEVPDAIASNEEVSERFTAFPSLKWDIFFGREDASHGSFAGPTLDYIKWEYETDTDKSEQNVINFGNYLARYYSTWNQNGIRLYAITI